MSSYYTAFKGGALTARALGLSGADPRRAALLAGLSGLLAAREISRVLGTMSGASSVPAPEYRRPLPGTLPTSVSGLPVTIPPLPLQIPSGWTLNYDYASCGRTNGSVVYPMIMTTGSCLAGGTYDPAFEGQIAENGATRHFVLLNPVQIPLPGQTAYPTQSYISNTADNVAAPYLPWSGSTIIPQPLGGVGGRSPTYAERVRAQLATQQLSYQAEPLLNHQGRTLPLKTAGVTAEPDYLSPPQARPLPPYVVPSYNIEIIPGVGVRPYQGVHALARPAPSVKERKVRIKGAFAGYYKAMSLYGKYTEAQDFINALYKALPASAKVRWATTRYYRWDKKLKRKVPVYGIRYKPTQAEKLQALLRHWDKMDPRKAARNLLVQEYEDLVVGIQGQLLRESNIAAQSLAGVHVPIGTSFRGGALRAQKRLDRDLRGAYDLIK